MRTYRISHRTTYRYDAVVTTSYGRAHLLPREQPGQTCEEASVTVTPTPAQHGDHTDFFGNRSTYFAVTTPHHTLQVLALSTVTVTEPPAPAAAPAWELVRDDLPFDARPYCLPSPRLPVHPGVTAYAGPSFPRRRPLDEAVTDLAARIHRDFRYAPGSSTVASTAAELLERGEGVCQDFAHLAVAGLRSQGLAARYVSGYLETTPPPGQERQVGADASHAWVSVWTGSGWLDLDPTNDRLVDGSYVELAHGRDFADVTPLKGVIFSGGGTSTLDVAVDMVRAPAG